ncbi:MAG: hypothetical protein ACFFBE_03045 [Promethearchaeota archaeon]
MSDDHLVLEEILSYFEKQDLQISSQLAEKLKTYNIIVESLSKYKEHVKDVLDKNLFYLQQLGEFLQIIKDIKSLFLDLETIYNEIADYYQKISLILDNILDLVIIFPYIAGIRTSPFGDRVRDTKISHFYVIDHQVLKEFLKNTKDLVTSEDISIIQTSPITDKLNQIIKIIPAIKAEYLPNVVYMNVPESFEQIITLSTDLRELFSPFYFLEKFGSLKEFMELVTNDFYNIEDFFKANPEKDSIKVKGKFKATYSNINKLYRVLSFQQRWDY